jgi:hypothetical protein
MRSNVMHISYFQGFGLVAGAFLKKDSVHSDSRI